MRRALTRSLTMIALCLGGVTIGLGGEQAHDQRHTLSMTLIEASPGRRLPLLEASSKTLIAARAESTADADRRTGTVLSSLDLRDGWLVEPSIPGAAITGQSLDQALVTVLSNRSDLDAATVRAVLGALGCIPVSSGDGGPPGSTLQLSLHGALLFVATPWQLVVLERAPDRPDLSFRHQIVGEVPRGSTGARGAFVERYQLGQGVLYVAVDGAPHQDSGEQDPVARRRRILVWDESLHLNPGLPGDLEYDELWLNDDQVVFARNTSHVAVPDDWPWARTACRCPAGGADYLLIHPSERVPALLFATISLGPRGRTMWPHRIFLDLAVAAEEPEAPSPSCGCAGPTSAAHQQDSWVLSWAYWCQLVALSEGATEVPVQVSERLRAALDTLAPTCASAPSWPVTELGRGDAFSYVRAVLRE